MEAFASFTSTYKLGKIEDFRRLLQQSLAIDPNYARSYAALTTVYCLVYLSPASEGFLNPAVLEQAYEFARKAVQLDRNLPEAHAALGVILPFKQQHDASIAAFDKAVALNPNFVDWRFGMALIRAGDPKRALDVVRASMRLDPFYVAWAPLALAGAHYMLGQYTQALPLLRLFLDGRHRRFDAVDAALNCPEGSGVARLRLL